MKLTQYTLTPEPTIWRLTCDSPPVFDVPLDGFRLVNPLIYHRLEQFEETPTPMIFHVGDGVYHLKTADLVFLHPEDREERRHFYQMGAGHIVPFLDRLYHVTKQIILVEIGRRGAHRFDAIEIDHLPDVPHLADNVRDELATLLSASSNHRYRREVAISPDSLEAVNSMPDDYEIPLADELLKDAILARNQRQYRSSILHSAMAMEVAAATMVDGVIEAEKEKVAQELEPSPRLNFEVVKVNGTDTTIKEPIYQRLRNLRGFSRYLRELPAYVLGRSIMSEDKSLYDDALEVYNTRNKIVHAGEPPDSDKYLSIDAEGSRSACNAAGKVLGWYGAEYPYPELRS